jgi:hypothetical protein
VRGVDLNASFRETQSIYPSSQTGRSGKAGNETGLEREDSGIDYQWAWPAPTGQSQAREYHGWISKF